MWRSYIFRPPEVVVSKLQPSLDHSYCLSSQKTQTGALGTKLQPSTVWEQRNSHDSQEVRNKMLIRLKLCSRAGLAQCQSWALAPLFATLRHWRLENWHEENMRNIRPNIWHNSSCHIYRWEVDDRRKESHLLLGLYAVLKVPPCITHFGTVF